MSQIHLLAGQRQKGETSRAIQACNDWLRLGRGRLLRDLLDQYAESDTESPPTRSWGTIRKWSSQFRWAERADEHDAELEAQKTAHSQEIMQTGLALDHERVVKLKWLAGFLEGQIKEIGTDGVHHNVWVPDVKQIGAGEYAERIDIERYNSAIISDYRGALDDLAKETGGRKRSIEHSGTGEGGAIVVEERYTDAQRVRGLGALFDAIRSGLIASDYGGDDAVDAPERSAVGGVSESSG